MLQYIGAVRRPRGPSIESNASSPGAQLDGELEPTSGFAGSASLVVQQLLSPLHSLLRRSIATLTTV